MRCPAALIAKITLASLAIAGCFRASAEDSAAVPEAVYDGVILNGMVYDGSGLAGERTDVAFGQGRIVALGKFSPGEVREGGFVVDATGKAVAPGFINMLSWTADALIHDGRSQGDIRQGVTLEVMGEGKSWGPWNTAQKAEQKSRQSDIQYDIEWTTLGEFLDYLVARGVSTNVASFVGATTVRVHEIGYEDRAPTPEELQRMQALVAQSMKEGALGVGSSLIYAPAYYASTDELVALASVAAEHGGMYISHMRNEGNRLLEAIDELITVSRESGAPAEIYHFKQAGEPNWSKYAAAVAKVEQARADGLRITADMYTYPASSTGLDAAMPPWVQEGGYEAWRERLRDPAIRARLQEEMLEPNTEWSNQMLMSGPDGTLLVGFRNPELRKYTGKTLSEVAEERGTNPQQTAMDLVIEDGSRVQVVYFAMSEDNVRRAVALPWMSFGSDAESLATEGVFLNTSTHPRAYGNFARLLGRYVRDEKVISLPEAIRKLTSLPAANLGLRNRGSLAPGFYADIVVFDPATINDLATYADPHHYSVGVSDVIVNGVPVLRDGEHTGATPGQVVRGPGWVGWETLPASQSTLANKSRK